DSFAPIAIIGGISSNRLRGVFAASYARRANLSVFNRPESRSADEACAFAVAESAAQIPRDARESAGTRVRVRALQMADVYHCDDQQKEHYELSSRWRDAEHDKIVAAAVLKCRINLGTYG